MYRLLLLFLFLCSPLYCATYDARLPCIIWAESCGGSQVEQKATIATFLHLIDTKGYEKAIRLSCAYTHRSTQFIKAYTGDFNAYELKKWKEMNKLLAWCIENKDTLPKYEHFENVKAFGTPKWAKGLKHDDIGRQRYYYK